MNAMMRRLDVLRRHPRPWRFLAGRCLAASGLCERLIIDQNGYRLRFYPSNLSEILFVFPDFRDADLAFFRACLRAGDHVVDVGANIGDVAALACSIVGPSGHVCAIEPHPRIFRYLEGNLALNGFSWAETINVAAGETDGATTIEDDRRDDMNRIGGDGVRIRMRRLDDLLPAGRRIDLMKLDVEGYELFALRGAPATLGRVDCLHFECSEALSRRFGYPAHAVPDLLREHGFSILRIVAPGGLAHFEALRADEVCNLVATRDRRTLLDRTGWRLA
jgi:FkbM family methyltransferase